MRHFTLQSLIKEAASTAIHRIFSTLLDDSSKEVITTPQATNINNNDVSTTTPTDNVEMSDATPTTGEQQQQLDTWAPTSTTTTTTSTTTAANDVTTAHATIGVSDETKRRTAVIDSIRAKTEPFTQEVRNTTFTIDARI